MEKYLGLPPVASAHGGEIDHLIALLHWLAFILFFGWGAFYIFTLVRFRKSKNPKADYAGVKSHASSYLEVVVAVVEVILLVGFSIPLWAKRVNEFPAEKDALIVRVVSEQFAWNIHYPGLDGKFGKTAVTLVDQDNPLGLDRTDPDAKDDITTINQLNLPVNKPVIIYISSKDVIHSFKLPLFRINQDAVPGMSIPLWFTPTKTLVEVQEELKNQFSIADEMKKSHKISLPQVITMTLTKGSSHGDLMLMKDAADASGGTVGSKGDKLTSENITKLVDAGITSVSVRNISGLDKFVSLEDYNDVKDTTGTMVLSKGDVLTEDAVTTLVEIDIKEVNVRPSSNVDTYIAMDTYNDKSGTAIVSKGEDMSDQIVTKLGDAGVNDITITPKTPTEIACAQLCGLGHFRMRGYVTVQTQEEFDKWVAEQVASLAPASSDPTAAK